MTGGRRISKGMSIGLIVGGDLVLLLLGWFLLVSPQRSTAQTTARAAQAAEVQIEQAQAPATQPTAITQPKQPEIQTAYLYKLSKAMPMTTDMPNLLLELNQVVHSAGVQLISITPTATDTTTGATGITLSVAGDFYSLTDLLYRLRSLVAVHHGKLQADGRLFNVDTVNFNVPAGSFPQISADLSVEAYVYVGGTTTPTTTTPTTTTPSTDPSLPSGATAAGVSP